MDTVLYAWYSVSHYGIKTKSTISVFHLDSIYGRKWTLNWNWLHPWCVNFCRYSAKKEHHYFYSSWYVKKNLVFIEDKYENLDLIVNTRSDSVIYGLSSQRTRRRERSAGDLLCVISLRVAWEIPVKLRISQIQYILLLLYIQMIHKS